MCAEGIIEFSITPTKPLVNNYIPINDCNQNENSNNNKSEIDPTHKPKSVKKDSNMDIPRNKNETNQVNQDQDSDIDTPRNKIETKHEPRSKQ